MTDRVFTQPGSVSAVPGTLSERPAVNAILAFTAVKDSIDKMIEQQDQLKRYDISGRKVIFYVENMKPDQQIAFSFQVKALYPVKAKGVTSTAYSYYTPDIKGETLGPAVTVH